jgi:hypothetical protein
MWNWRNGFFLHRGGNCWLNWRANDDYLTVGGVVMGF